MRRNYTLVIALLILAVAVGVYAALSVPTAPIQYVPVSLRSVLRPDYSAGPETPIAPAGFSLVATALHDNAPGAGGLDAQVATLQAGMLTPIPTVTPAPTVAGPTAAATAGQFTSTPGATPTPRPQIVTPTPSGTPLLSVPSLTPLPTLVLPTGTLLPTLSVPTVTLLPTLSLPSLTPLPTLALPTSTLLPLPTLPIATPTPLL